jgi:hypothetical protein
LKFEESSEAFSFVAWGFKNAKIIIHITYGPKNKLDECVKSRSAAFRLEYDRQSFKSVIQRYSSHLDAAGRDGSKRRMDLTKQQFWQNPSILTDIGDRIGKLCAFLDQNLRNHECSYKRAMAATMQRAFKSNRKMHEIEEESDDYSCEDTSEKENVSNQI